MKTGILEFVHRLISRPSLIGLGFFAALCVIVGAGRLESFDWSSMRFLQSFGSKGLDCFVAAFGYLGSAELTGLAALFFALTAYHRFGPAAALAVIAAMALGTVIELAAKLYLPQMPIPEGVHRFCRRSLPGGFVHLDTPNSFPSGHTFRSVFLFFLAARLWAPGSSSGRRIMAGAAWALSVLMAVSRVYIGDHWMSDVAGGFCLAWLACRWPLLENTALSKAQVKLVS
ncbi:MAG: phosphatase PAP2 family protein [Elusimicrobia bacterium]|nr:phosphatase PAP2 family protein [Elusimicrobiota bacterium]